MPQVTFQNTDGLTVEVLRNTMIETVDQMERINIGTEDGYASASSIFPMVDMDAPEEAYYTFGGVRGGMPAAHPDAESPIGTLTLPSKRTFETHSYKEKINPKKEVEVEMDRTPFSLFQYGASYLNIGTWLTRELIAWRGDEYIDGLIGQYGDTPHPDLDQTNNVDTPSTAWSDTANATPYEDVEALAYQVKDNGRLLNNSPPQPVIWMPPSLLRDMRLNQDLRSKISDNRDKTLGVSDIENLLADDISSVQQVMVNVPRTNANGEFIDESGDVVDDADDAVLDNVLEPYDPNADAVKRHAIIGRPGANSAFMPWFLDKLTTKADEAPMTSDLSIDTQRGYFTQMWAGDDPISTWMKAGQDIGFHIRRPENWAILSDL
ncbi:hypothetical protein C2R22_05955 [Salinigranum rubrum]|uniref:Capsid protein n=1 Tax=Salinigranum rubrum TaxID=755307 RepID=A0A2I8VH55_9EURY|nr:hypothetical protein [Salinigranum rubrum]AUV81262.1 hypothetical protein C2R22_05955 [Salinigranum rubrum]